MKISVIIPAYNEEERIGAALRVLMAQDYPDFEVIVVDNGSNDRTAEVIRAVPKVILVREDRKGTMWACERGRQEATGDIIVRMDADCLPDAAWLSRGAAYFNNRHVVIVSGPYDYYDGAAFMRYANTYVVCYIYAAANVLLRVLHVPGGVTMGGNTFIRASALKAIGGFNTNLVFYGDDTDLPKRLSVVGRCIFDPRLLVKSSARRFKKEGVLRLETRYLFHFFKQIFS